MICIIHQFSTIISLLEIFYLGINTFQKFGVAYSCEPHELKIIRVHFGMLILNILERLKTYLDKHVMWVR